jgi:hypothetical protein
LNLTKQSNIFIAVMLATCHNGVMRSGELLSGLQVADILWSNDRSMFRLHFRRSKTYREGEGYWVTYKDFGKNSAVSLMVLWFDHNNLWNETDLCIFPAKKRSGELDFIRTLSTSSFRRMLKREVRSIGLNDAHYSGHSLRAGGATDLFMMRVPYYIIKKMGRWVSDAALIYYRDDEDVEEAVYKAFKNGTETGMGVKGISLKAQAGHRPNGGNK